MAARGQDWGLPLGNQILGVAAPALNGLIDKDRMVDRIVFTSTAAGASTPMTGVVTALTVGGQNLLQSDAPTGFPIEMIASVADDDGAFIGCPIKGGLSVACNATLDAAADTSAIAFTSILPEGVSPVPDEDDYNFIFPMGDVAVAPGAAFTLTATARRNVTLGRLVMVAVSGAGAYAADGTVVNSILVAGAEILSGAGSISFVGAPSDNINPLGPTANDSDGLRIDLAIEAGETVTITGTSVSGCNVRGGIYLEEA